MLQRSCDNFLAQYATVLDASFDRNKTLLEPSAVLFTSTGCSPVNEVTLNDGRRIPGSEDMPGYIIGPASGTIRSLYIPIHMVVSIKGVHYVGPLAIADLSTLDLGTISVNDIQVVRRDPWNSIVLSGCMGREIKLGQTRLSSLLPQSAVCDAYIGDYCKTHGPEDICGCFADLPTVQVQSQTAGVQLPVQCFGTRCTRQHAYKTYSMSTTPCSLTVCQQTISNSNGTLDPTIGLQGELVIHCGGKYYDITGNIVLNQTPSAVDPGVPILITQEITTEITQSNILDTKYPADIVTWILFLIAAVALLVITYLFFSKVKTVVSTDIPNSNLDLDNANSVQTFIS